ncbi:unnamed protein product [Brugia pahangi]|uniref:Flagellar hook protein FlgE n=1 Tax=Brugia pahangi TaxID=6280 RepID=A0A0N4TGZ8_BRUPA|nr:unnamed protein product [Brugia pahangi]
MYSPPPRPGEILRRHTTDLVSSVEVNALSSVPYEPRTYEKPSTITGNHYDEEEVTLELQSQLFKTATATLISIERENGFGNLVSSKF